MKSGSSRGVSICMAMRRWLGKTLKQLREEISKEWQWVMMKWKSSWNISLLRAISDYIGCSNS